MHYDKISLPVKCQIAQPADTEAPPCTRIKGSYLVESAVALPFYAGFMAVLLFFFQALTVQQEVGGALLKTGRELAVLACRQEDGDMGGGAPLAVQVLFQKHLGKGTAASRFIRGGRLGISFQGSSFAGSFIELRADYELRLPVALFHKRGMAATQRVSVRKWIGRGAAEGADGELVYITPAGSVYHKNRGCSYLNPSVSSVNKSQIGLLRNRSGGKYAPCGSCMKKAVGSSAVYITPYGDRYHSRKDCKGLKRTVYAVRLQRITGRSACSKCGKE